MSQLEFGEQFKLDKSGAFDFYKHFENQLCASLAEPSVLFPTIYYYDDLGSEIYENLCRSENYYLTRSELALLQNHAPSVSSFGPFDHIIEFGSGSSVKTHLILESALSVSKQLTYCPIDINGEVISAASEELFSKFPSLPVHGVVGDYQHGIRVLGKLPGRKLFLFLGSTFSQFSDEETHSFLKLMRQVMSADDCFMIGFDLFKSCEIHELAYNCNLAQRHQLNGLSVINNLYDGDIDIGRFSSFAKFNDVKYQIEMFYRSEITQTVKLGSLGKAFTFQEGILSQTHIMKKYKRDMVLSLFDSHDFSTIADWQSEDGGWGIFTFSSGS